MSYPGKGVVDGEGGVLRIMETHTTGGSFPGFSRIFSRIFPLRFGRDTAEVACACARALSISVDLVWRVTKGSLVVRVIFSF